MVNFGRQVVIVTVAGVIGAVISAVVTAGVSGLADRILTTADIQRLYSINFASMDSDSSISPSTSSNLHSVSIC